MIFSNSSHMINDLIFPVSVLFLMSFEVHPQHVFTQLRLNGAGKDTQESCTPNIPTEFTRLLPNKHSLTVIYYAFHIISPSGPSHIFGSNRRPPGVFHPSEGFFGAPQGVGRSAGGRPLFLPAWALVD